MRDWRRGIFDCMGGVADQAGGNLYGPYPYWSEGDDAFVAEPPAEEPEEELSQNRKDLLALIDKWMPTSLLAPKKPEGESQDLLAACGWTKARGVTEKKVKDDGGNPATSCGDVLGKLLALWGCPVEFAFGIRDVDSKNRKPGAKGRGWYIEATGSNNPRPGDIVVLRRNPGPENPGSVGHVGVLVARSRTIWRTADGGGGTLPDQTATVVDRPVEYTPENIPILISPTDKRKKRLDGWVSLDLIPRVIKV